MRKHGGIEEILRTRQAPGVIGTRDSFGIGRNFYHLGKEITTYKEWEKAGYTDLKDDPSIPPDVKKEALDQTKLKKKIRGSKYEDKAENRMLNRLYLRPPKQKSLRGGEPVRGNLQVHG